MEKFELAIVGGGPAGLTCAYVASKLGVQTIVLERGNSPGTKTVSGGLLYTHVLKQIFPNFWEEGFFERVIERYLLTFLSKDRATSLDFFDTTMSKPPYNAVSVLRSKLDRWLASKAQEAGAFIATGVRVDELLKENGKVVGLKSGSDEIRCDIVVVCDGINSLVSKSSGVLKEWKGRQLGIGVKQVLRLDKNKIEERFLLKERGGVEYTFLGFPEGVEGGGFLYTNYDSLSLGLILNMESVVKQKVEMWKVLEDFKSHPFVSRLVEGAEVEEYSTCLVAEGGLEMVPTLYSNGYLLAGSAAGLVLNTGFNLRGMDFAIASGAIAGEVAAQAIKRKEFSSNFLSIYEKKLKESFVLRDLKRYSRYPAFFSNERLYSAYPRLVNEFLHGAYFVDGSDKGHLYDIMKSAMRDKVSAIGVLKDLVEAMRAI